VSPLLAWPIAILASIGIIALGVGLLVYAKVHEDP
jgi:hypothetical protein